MREIGPVKVTILGTGTSTGIPVIGCNCRVCTSNDPRDKRLRCSCFIEVDGLSLLVDAGPDLRTQALRADIKQVDAVLVTHHHFDHVVGLDDLRPYFFGNPAPIPCYAEQETADTLRNMFRYIFQDGSYPGVSKLEMHEVSDSFAVPSRYGLKTSVKVQPIPTFHGKMPIYGFRVGNFAYLTDTNRIPPASFDLLRGLDVLVLDALRHEPHRSHFTVAEALAVVEKLAPRQTYFTHMTHSMLHAEEDAALPAGVALGYDGLQFIAT